MLGTGRRSVLKCYVSRPVTPQVVSVANDRIRCPVTAYHLMARLLLDTHVFLWWVGDDPALDTRARRAIASAENDCSLSVASCWEMAIKASLGKLRLTADAAFAAYGVSLLG